MVNLFVYTKQENDVSKRLIHVIIGLKEVNSIEISHDFESFKSRVLLKLEKRQALGVLCITTLQELNTMLSFHAYLEDMKLILILPDRNRQTISEGHKLHPRYVSYVDSDFSDVGAVLEKMIENNRHGEQKSWQQLDRIHIEDPEGCPS